MRLGGLFQRITPIDDRCYLSRLDEVAQQQVGLVRLLGNASSTDMVRTPSGQHRGAVRHRLGALPFADGVEDDVVFLNAPGEVFLRVVTTTAPAPSDHRLEIGRAAHACHLGSEVCFASCTAEVPIAPDAP
jgi:hypothetical protein